MKTSFKSFASALLLSLTVSVSSPVLATDDKTQTKAFAVVMYPAADASKLWLNLEKYQSENKIKLTMTDQDGQVLFQETVCSRNSKNSKKNAYRQQFDMSQLKDGTYTFRISAGRQEEMYTFKLSTPVLEATQPTRLIAIK